MAEEREHVARADKAKKIAKVFDSHGIKAEVAARLSDEGWVIAAQLASVNLRKERGRRPYVSRPTRSAVVALLSLLQDLREENHGS